MPSCRRRKCSKAGVYLSATVATAITAPSAWAQIDASWIGPAAFVHDAVFASQPGPVNVLNQGHDWTTEPNWSMPPFPTDAGAATITSPLTRDSQGRIIITLDTDVTLRELVLSNSAGVDITDTQPAIHAVMHAASLGLTIRAQRYHPDAPSRATYLGSGNTIAVPIGGDGAVNVTGGAIVTFAKPNPFTGPLSISNGVLAVGGGSGLDARLGGGTAPVTLDGGTIRTAPYGTSPAVVNRDFALGPAGGTFAVAGSNDLEINGSINGNGSFRLENGTIRLNAANNYSGATVVAGEGLVVRGSIRWSASMDVTGQLHLVHSTGSSLADRVGDAAPILLRGATLSITSLDSTPYREAVGAITAAGGVSTIRFGADGTALESSMLLRQSGGGMFIDGARIGSGGATFSFANGKALTNTAGGIGLSQGIIPWIWAYHGADVEPHSGAGHSSLVTYGNSGVRPLDLLMEYRQSFTGVQTGENVRVTSSQSIGPAGATINALLLGSVNNADNGTPSTLTGGTISVTSGAILNTTRGNLVFNNINFGDAEGVIISASTAGGGGDQGIGVWGSISGNNGLTKLGPGNLFLGGTNTYRGATTISGGRLTIDGEVLPLVVGPLGQSDAPIILVAAGTLPGAAEAGATRLASQFAGGTLTIGRPVIVRGAAQARSPGAVIDSTSDAGIVHLSGGISLESADAPLAVTRGTVYFSSALRGPGRFRDAGAATIIFAAASPQWTGGIEMGLGNAPATYLLASDGALGSGTVFVGAAAMTTVRSAGGRRTIDNPLVFALAAAGSAITLDGALSFTGPMDFGGNIGRPIIVPQGAEVTISAAATNGSFRLLGTRFGTSSPGGTLSIESATYLDGRIFVGAPEYQSPQPIAATPGGVLRITHPAALGRAGVQVDADGSTLHIDGTGSGVLIDPANAFIRGTGVDGLGAVHSSGGDNAWRGNIALSADAVIGVADQTTFRIEGALADLSAATPGFGNASLTKVGAGTLLLHRLANGSLATGGHAGPTAKKSRLDSVRINDGRIVIADAPGVLRSDQVSVVRELSIAGFSQLDLRDSALIVDYDPATPSDTPFAAIANLVHSGYANGNWNGFGIASSAAGGNTALAVVEARDVYASFPVTFLQREIDESSLIVCFALGGDANVDGVVDLSDFAALAARFNQPGRWIEGDFDYDESVGLGDFALLAQNLNRSVWDAIPRQVPEPASVCLILSTIFFRRPS